MIGFNAAGQLVCSRESLDHSYRYVYDPGISWTEASQRAQALSSGSGQCYLATITTQAELDLIESLKAGDGQPVSSKGNIYIGSQKTPNTIDEWSWAFGPEKGTIFWKNGAAVGNNFPGWDPEPGYRREAAADHWGGAINNFYRPYVTSIYGSAIPSLGGGGNSGYIVECSPGSGMQGPKGDAGEPGPQGDSGPQGSTGPQGADGAQGPQGAIGPQGPKGEDGSNVYAGQSCPAGAYVTGFDMSGHIICSGMPDCYKLTSATFAYNADVLAGVKSEFGSAAKLAEWNTIKSTYGSSLAAIQAFMNSVGIPNPTTPYDASKGNVYVTYGGAEKVSGYYRYFVTRFNGSPDGSYAVLDDIQGNQLVLGRYDWSSKALVNVCN